MHACTSPSESITLPFRVHECPSAPKNQPQAKARETAASTACLERKRERHPQTHAQASITQKVSAMSKNPNLYNRTSDTDETDRKERQGKKQAHGTQVRIRSLFVVFSLTFGRLPSRKKHARSVFYPTHCSPHCAPANHLFPTQFVIDPFLPHYVHLLFSLFYTFFRFLYMIRSSPLPKNQSGDHVHHVPKQVRLERGQRQEVPPH